MHKLIPGFNDLETLEPDLAKEWHLTRNGDLKPSTVSRGSDKKVWWQCSKHPDHIWDATIKSRSIGGNRCPVCIGRKVIKGVNDLETLEPDLAKEWHLTRNGDLKPSNVTRGSKKRIWWQCSKHPDHIWDVTINNRTTGYNCPICSGSQVLKGFNDLETLEPDLAKEWHLTRNGDLKPSTVSRGSKQKVWWQCSKHPDHIWDAEIQTRTNGGNGCPICSGSQVLKGFNDLATLEPDLAKEWHLTRNGDLKPSNVTRGSKKRIWWQCSKHPDHIWDATINNRTKGHNCPICSNQQVLKGFNDLETLEPDLAKEWHLTRNGDLKPSTVSRGSKQKVWWQCSKHPDHIWDAEIRNRSTLDTGCPYCAESGFNPDKDAWFYLMERPGEQQLGISNFIENRLKKHELNGWTLIEHTSVPAKGKTVLDTEKAFKKWLRKEIGLMKGSTENWSTTKMEVHSLAELKARSGIETDLF